MDLEAFPEIQDFQHLPRQIIVKGGNSSYNEAEGAVLKGIVINNIGQPVRNVRVAVVIFNEKKIPVLNLTTPADPPGIQQGGISTFSFRIRDYPKKITDYHLLTDWTFDDQG